MESVRLLAGCTVVVMSACGGAKAAGPAAEQRALPDRLASGDRASSTEEATGTDIGATRRAAQKRTPPPPPPRSIVSIVPTKGFVDAPLAFDASERNLLYINGDVAKMAQLVEFDPAQGSEVARVDVSKITRLPSEIAEVVEGEQYWVLGQAGANDKRSVAAVVDTKGKALRTWGPATSIARSQYQGQPVVVVYQRSEQTGRENRPTVVHSVEAFSLKNGKRVGQAGRLQTDLLGKSVDLDFQLNHWRHGYLTAVGIKGGEYDPKEDQRTPNVEGWYDLVGRTFSKEIPIADPIAHASRFRDLQGHDNQFAFVSVARDLSGLMAFEDGQGPRPVELPEPLHYYLHKSLSVQPADPGQPLYFSLEVDPVNPDAVARKRADERFLDIYRLDSGASTAIRVGRLPLDESSSLRWRARPGFLVAGPKHVGFSRGGPSIHVYEMAGDRPAQANP